MRTQTQQENACVSIKPSSQPWNGDSYGWIGRVHLDNRHLRQRQRIYGAVLDTMPTIICNCAFVWFYPP